MPRTRECDFCGTDIEPGTGTMLVLNDGNTHHFCSAKCEKNVDLGREARHLEWTARGQAQGGSSTAQQEETEAAEAEEEEPTAEATEADEADADEEADAGETEDAAEADADEATEADEADADEETEE